MGLLAHPVSVPLAIAAMLWVAVVYPRRLALVLAGVAAGAAPLLLWLATGGRALKQLLAQLDRDQMLIEGAVRELDRWAVLLRGPDPGGITLIAIVAVSALRWRRSSAGALALTTWLATSVLDHRSGGNYAVIVLPLAVMAATSLVFTSVHPKRWATLGTLLTLLGLRGVTQSALDHRGRTPPSIQSLIQKLDPSDRVFVQMKLWPLLQDRPAVVPFFAMQWARRPEDERSLTQRLDDWCPTVVVRSRGAWPFELVRDDWGGRELQAWLGDAVDTWQPAPITGFDEGIEVGRIRPGRCERPSGDR